jgi:hypothetical protein
MKALLIFLAMLSAAPLFAQPRLDMRLLRPNAPDYYYYQLYFFASCGDDVIYDLEKWQLILVEPHDVVDSNDYILDRIPSADRNACYDAALLFDNSSGISIPTLNTCIAGGRLFIDAMSLDCQSVSIISFADRPIIHSFLSNDRESSKLAFDEMIPGGKRVLYDAIYAGLIELRLKGRQGNAAVVAVTAGPDNGSSIPVRDLLKTARDNNIRIFVFGIGGATADPALVDLCRQTGGMFYAIANEDEFASRFTDFEGFIRRDYDEYRLVRRTRNPDMREMRLRMRLEACGDSVWTERSFIFSPVLSVERYPQTLTLYDPYPNPLLSGEMLHIPFVLHDAYTGTELTITLHDALGRRIATSTEQALPERRQVARVQTSYLSPGVYHFRLYAGTSFRSGMFVVLR